MFSLHKEKIILDFGYQMGAQNGSQNMHYVCKSSRKIHQIKLESSHSTAESLTWLVCLSDSLDMVSM